jgi:hypothetical protein
MPLQQREGFWLWTGGPVPRGADGITLGRVVIVRRGHDTNGYLLRHEQVHVRQWRRHGTIGFTTRYLGHYLLGRLRKHGHRAAYLRIPFEIEADWIARRTGSTLETSPESETIANR